MVRGGLTPWQRELPSFDGNPSPLLHVIVSGVVDILIFQQLAVSLGLGLLLGWSANGGDRRSAAFARFPLFHSSERYVPRSGRPSADGSLRRNARARCDRSFREFCSSQEGHYRSWHDDRSRSSIALRSRGADCDRIPCCRGCHRRRHGPAPALKEATAQFCQRGRRARYASNHAVCFAQSCHSSDPAIRGLRSLRRLESFQDLADGSADRWHQSRRICCLQVLWRSGRVASRGHYRRVGFEHRDNR